MHELSVCQALVDQLRDLATRESAQRITRVLLRVGPMSGVVSELLEHAFPIAAAGTVAEGAAIAIEDAALRVRCRSCGAETDAEREKRMGWWTEARFHKFGLVQGRARTNNAPPLMQTVGHLS